MVNYMKLRKLSLNYVYYVYLDSRECVADSLFVQEKITVEFNPKREVSRGGFSAVFAKVNKKDEDKFLHALSRISDTCMIRGIKGYDEEVEHFNSVLESVGKT